jgi:patatin-like phospholipase/acyl hydrolase
VSTPTPATLMALIEQIGTTAAQVQDIVKQRELLQNYKATRDTYAANVTQAKTDLDALVNASAASLKALRDAITNAYGA